MELLKVMNSDAIRFLGFVLILFVYVNNLISLFMGLGDYSALTDCILLTIFYGIVIQLSLEDPEE